MAFQLEKRCGELTCAADAEGGQPFTIGKSFAVKCRPQHYVLSWMFPMGLFTADLYRSFAVGFGLGALMLALTFGSQLLTAF